MCGEIQSHYLLIFFPDISSSLLRLLLHFGLAMFFSRPLKRSDRPEAVPSACVRAVRGNRSTCPNGIKQIRWNTSSHKYKHIYRGQMLQRSILLPPLVSLSRMPQDGGGATRWTRRHCTAGPRRETQNIARSGSQIGNVAVQQVFSFSSGHPRYCSLTTFSTNYN